MDNQMTDYGLGRAPDGPVPAEHTNIRLISAEQTWPLRHLVLRTGRPLSTCRWEGDDLPSAHHFALFEGAEPVVVASMYHRGHEAAPSPDSWQLRGMACRPDRQGHGLGTRLLVHVLDACRSQYGGRMMWCNARMRASSLYRRYGFRVWGDEFTIPGIGAHCLMVREL